MKLLLTAAGVDNPTILEALVGMLGKPIEESTALCIPTAQYGHPKVGMGVKPWQFISGNEPHQMVDLGWKSVGMLELTALPSLDKERWMPVLEAADALLVAGGDVIYLAHWLRESGLADLIPTLTDTVWVGLSAGSMVMAPRVGYDFVQWEPPTGRDDTTLGVVDFAICPHLVPDGGQGNTMADAEEWAATIPGPKYAMDDSSAIAVVDGSVEVVSEGEWRYFPG
ncbi:MAG: Type 1 glutamine amidotransferase-like domain-containing protein [Nocardioides sp.]